MAQLKDTNINGILTINDEPVEAVTSLLLEQAVSDDYTLVLGDRDKLVSMTNAADKTLTVPPNGAVAFPIGTQIALVNKGAGALLIAEGAGVTILSAGSLSLLETYATAALLKLDANTWLLAGALA